MSRNWHIVRWGKFILSSRTRFSAIIQTTDKRATERSLQSGLPKSVKGKQIMASLLKWKSFLLGSGRCKALKGPSRYFRPACR